MRFADLSIAEIVAEYNLPSQEVCHLGEQLGIAYNTKETRRALEDAKAIISNNFVRKTKVQSHQLVGQSKLNLLAVSNGFGKKATE